MDVVIIGGATLDTGNPCTGAPGNANSMDFTGGGCLPVSGPAGELDDFVFAAMAPADVNATNLAPFDTAVLNMASGAMACDSSTLSIAQQDALVAFVEGGHKLIIYDSECAPAPVDYSWLPGPLVFETVNPGALGLPGTVEIEQDNLLSTLIADPDCSEGDIHCINVEQLGPGTDAVGDMNVMTNLPVDTEWCLDMTGTNAIGVTGSAHAYAGAPSGADNGLYIYNGFDQDFQTLGDPELRKLWVQELQHPFNPSGLDLAPDCPPVRGPTNPAQCDPDDPDAIVGTSGDDALIGTPGNDIIIGLEGNDRIAGRGGDDCIDAGSGDNQISAGAGNDIVLATDGDDVVSAGLGNDLVNVGDGNNAVSGGAGDDTIEVGSGDDNVSAGPGDDSVDAGDGDNDLSGGPGNDKLEGGDGSDDISGGPGDDEIDAGAGDDTVSGGPGADTCSGAEVASSCDP